MSNNIFEPINPIRFGWNTLKSNRQFFVVLMVIVTALYYIPALIQIMFLSKAISPPEAFSLEMIAIFSVIIYVIIYQVVELGLLSITLDFRDGKSPEIEDLFSNYRLFLKYFAASIIYGLMVAIGFILLIVPGIYLALKYTFYGYLIVDKGLGPIEALKESGRMTEGAKKDLFVFWLTLGCSILIIMIFLGLFIAIPVGVITAAISKDLVPIFAIVANLISMIINLLIIVPITKLSMADIYRILQVRLAASVASPAPAPAEA
jgi:uncharacterized membrane protein